MIRVHLAEPLRHAGNLLLPFGSDRGGMIVEASAATLRIAQSRARWSMFAPNGLGPYTPTFAALALAQRFVRGDRSAASARDPASRMLTLEDFEPEFNRHGFSTQHRHHAAQSPFDTALGAAFDDTPHPPSAPPTARPRHAPSRRSPRAGRNVTARSSFAARLFGMPRSAERIPVRVTMRLDASKRVWTRQFGDRRMQSRLRTAAPGIVRESFGPFDFDMKVSVADGVLTMTIIGWRIGPIPLPAFLAPHSTATETEDEQGRFHFDVPIALPLIGRLTHYSGWLDAEEVEAAPAPSEKETA